MPAKKGLVLVMPMNLSGEGIAGSDKGHALFLTSDVHGVVTVFCSKCGSHTSFRSQNLKAWCKPQQSGTGTHGGRALAAFFAIPSVHPHTGEILNRPYPVGKKDVEDAVYKRNMHNISSMVLPEPEVQNLSPAPDAESEMEAEGESGDAECQNRQIGDTLGDGHFDPFEADGLESFGFEPFDTA